MEFGSHQPMSGPMAGGGRRATPAVAWLLSAAFLSAAVLLSLGGCAAPESAARSGGPSHESAAGLGAVKAVADEELVIELGPLDLPAGASHHGAPQLPPLSAALPLEGWIHGYEVSLVDEGGRPVPRRLLHHVNLIVPGKRELFSPIMLRIGAAGPETDPVKLPRLLGYRVHRGDTLVVTAMMHNPEPRAYRGVRLRIRMSYTPRGRWMSPLSIYPFYMDVMPPAGVHAYDLPAGRSQKSWEARPAVAGRILGVGGHLHKYGVALRLEDVTAREVLWEATPTLDNEGNVVGMPIGRFFWQLGRRVHPDHVYRLTAVYENPTGRVIPDGAMGALSGVFLPDRPDDWPAVNERDPQYQLDVAVTYRRDQEQDGHGEHEHGSH